MKFKLFRFRVTPEQFAKFQEIRASKKTDMFDGDKVLRLSNGVLTHDSYLYILKNYQKLFNKWAKPQSKLEEVKPEIKSKITKVEEIEEVKTEEKKDAQKNN